MTERLSALKANLRILLQRVEKIKIHQPDYQVNEILQRIELKVDEMSDLLTELERMGGD